MSTTIAETTDLSTIASAGLGRKAKTAAAMNGGPRAIATDGETWVEVWTDRPVEFTGPTDSVDPAPARADIVAGATIGGRDLRRIVAGIVPATDTESSRYALGGTLLEIAEGSMLTAVGTDGRRLHAGHVQPVTIRGQAAPIVRAEQWQALVASIRAAGRKLFGVAGRRLEAVVDRGEVRVVVGTHQATGGHVVEMDWTSSPDDGGQVTIRVTGLAVAGRFPRWRDCIPAGGQVLTVNVDRVADALAEYEPLHRAAEKAGKAAWKADQEERKRRRQYAGGQYQHPIGVDCHSAGMIGRGAEWSSVVVATPVAVKLDHRYLADALAGAAAWGASAANVGGTDGISAVTLRTAEHGPRFEAVIMPLAMD